MEGKLSPPKSTTMDSRQQSVNARDDKAIPWPSERIPPGGLFHTPKIEYSKETADLLNMLMEESKMSMLMRKKINYHLRRGDPLPKPEPPRLSTKDPDANALEIMRRARLAKRKSLEQILASGAYDPSNYRPRPTDRMPSEKAKQQLQEAMSGLRVYDLNAKPKRKPRIKNDFHASEADIIDELLDQINERAEWLAEMEELGEGKRFRDEVREQIAERLRHIKGLQVKMQIQKSGIRYVD